MRFAFNSRSSEARGRLVCCALLFATCSRDRSPADSTFAAPLRIPPPAAISDDERRHISHWLSFISERDRDLEVYAIKPSGAAERRLTRRPGGDYNGPASPDGTQLIITSVQESAGTSIKEQRLFLLSFDEAETPPRLFPLGPPRPVVRHPSFTTDGQYVVFEGTSRGYRDLFRIRRDGGELRQLTNNPEGNFEPSLSPQGAALVFVSSRDRAAEIYRARLDGSLPQRLTQTARDEWAPRLSADGSQLVFASDRDGADRLYLSRADGSQVRRLSDLPLDTDTLEEAPCFSPRGSLLAYVVRKRGGRGALHVFELATGARRQLATDLDADLGEPAFSPDGRYLAFSARKGRDSQIHLARAAGSGAVRVTSAAGPNWNPQWIPARNPP
jgi:TolB protein